MRGGGGGWRDGFRANHQDVNITFFELYEFIFKFSPLKTVCLPRCRFQTLHVVASLSQQVTKLAWLHVFLLLKISPFVVCTLQYIPDSTVTGTLKPQGRGLLYERGGDARRLSLGDLGSFSHLGLYTRI